MNDIEYHLFEELRGGRLTRRQFIARATVLGLTFSTAGTILAACGGKAASPSSSPTSGPVKRGGAATVAVLVPAQQVDPVTMYSTGAIVTAQAAGEYLAFPNPDYSLTPRLATSWGPVGGSVGTWEFKIRQGVKWHDGSLMTVDDVVATFALLTNPKIGSAALSSFSGVLSEGGAEKVDEETVRFTLDRPYADFPYLVTPFTYNAIILPKGYKIGSFGKGGIGTGPFILKEYVTGQEARLVANPNYWGSGLPYLDTLVIKYYQDVPSQVLALEGGAVDVMDDTPFEGSQALLANPSIAVLPNPSSEYRTIQMRTDMKPFDDVRVRQAVAYALNRPQILQSVLGGRGQLGNDHAFAPIYPDAPKQGEIPQRAQDYAMAKKLLGEAGYPNGLTVTLTTEQFNEIPTYAQVVKEMCKPAGITVNLNVEPQSAYYGSGSNQPWLLVPFGITDWAARGTASQTIDPAYLSRSVPNKTLSNAGAAWNSAHWSNPQFDALMKQFEAEVDSQRRHQLAVQAATIQRDQVPDVIAYWIEQLRTTRKNVHGIAPGVYAFDPRAMWQS